MPPITRPRDSAAGFIILLILYLTAAFLVNRVARSQAVLTIGDMQMPVTTFTGILSSLGNIIIIFLVVYFRKTGFITALIVLALQFPMMLWAMLVAHTLSTVPGVFGNLFTVVAILMIHSRNNAIDEFQRSEIVHLKEQQKFSQHLFEQTATALVNAVDAKDTYSHGHSLRVAEYSEKIAKAMNMSDEDCYKVYYTALLHDVGKIGISDEIINKPGRLTPEEYEIIKQHPGLGNQILSSISEYPYLSIGAHFHHERYDGKGYPIGLKGEDIPEIARIISVADAYDAMSSNRSYRDAIPQQLVREEIIKGAGTQFDPQIAKIMQHLIDQDTEYHMKERDSIKELAGRDDLNCNEYRSAFSDGIQITSFATKIHMRCTSGAKGKAGSRPPAIILFDSLDGRVHDEEKTIRDLNYFEYCEIWFDGHTAEKNTRKIRVSLKDHKESWTGSSKNETIYDIEAVRYRDHVLVTVNDGSKTIEVIAALPDSTRFSFISLTGENCRISDVRVTTSDTEITSRYIPRIAEEISYISGPAGDIPNLQIDGHRSAATEGIPVTDGMKISFHTMSLPTARLIWHCPYISLFYADDREVYGDGFLEYSMLRLDGENIHGGENARNDIHVKQTDDFGGWEAWKKANKDGLDCTVSFKRNGDQLIVTTENLGLSIRNVTTFPEGYPETVYAAITGDQCVVTNIRISR
ncbi:MAG: HD domain-containing protein [Lachnospiraceae bacterium]|nr:HD domain-containing protein [Lachnospiraceae bacterium]